MTVRRKNGCGGKEGKKAPPEKEGRRALGRKKRGNLLNCLREGMKILENCCFKNYQQYVYVRAFCTIIFVGAEVKISLLFCCCCCSGSPMQSRDRSSSPISVVPLQTCPCAMYSISSSPPLFRLIDTARAPRSALGRE